MRTSWRLESTPEQPPAVRMVSRPARDDAGRPTLRRPDAVALLRRHIDLDPIDDSAHDGVVWQLWVDAVARGQPREANGDVLARIYDMVRRPSPRHGPTVLYRTVHQPRRRSHPHPQAS